MMIAITPQPPPLLDGCLQALLSDQEGSNQSHLSNFNLGCAYQAMGQSEKALPLLQVGSKTNQLKNTFTIT